MDRPDANAKANYLFNLGDLKEELKERWIADSGASAHMCNNREWFKALDLFKEPKTCNVGDGRPIAILGKGSVEVTSKVGDKENNVTLTNVLFIPSLATNLISIGVCTGQDVISTFTKKGVTMKKNNEVVVTGTKLTDQLFLLNMIANKSHQALVIKHKRTRAEWHEALGHPCDKTLEILLKDKAVEVGERPIEKADCSICPMGKGARSSHPSKAEMDIKQVGELVHVDLSSKVNKSAISGSNYYLLCKDHESEYCYIELVKDKKEVFEKLAKIIVSFESESDQTIRAMQSDNGSEFINDKVNTLLLKEGIRHQTSANYTPQQNGIVEREMRTLGGMARTMLLASDLPLELWDEAISTACYLKNRLPTSN